MEPAPADRRGTRDEILAWLCIAPRTVGQLAEALGISRNAVREHLVRLADDGLVQHEPVRGSVGKPAYEYRLTSEGEMRLSRAYLPLLRQTLLVLERRLSPAEMEAVFRAAGHGLAPPERPGGDAAHRVAAAVEVLRGLGGVVTAAQSAAGKFSISCTCCAIGAIVNEHPLACRGIEAMLEEYLDLPVRERCRRSGRPACRFEIGGVPGPGAA